jgi:hypothetical protein
MTPPDTNGIAKGLIKKREAAKKQPMTTRTYLTVRFIDSLLSNVY